MGNVISISDPVGTITYNLRADGQVNSITAPGGVTTSFEYDGYGRQTKIIDPSAGTSITTYDAAGNISQQTDANGKVTKSTYDNYYRITNKEIVGELTTTYTYNSDGQPQSVSSSNGTGRTYTYDNQMRVITEKESVVDGKWLQKTFSYANGITSTIAYSSHTGNIATENYIYSNGVLSEIKLNNSTSIWKLTQENDLGLATEVTSGDGKVVRSYGYDSYGLPTARSIKNGSTYIQNFSYNFTATTGNLNWRKDNNRNIQENFTYDNMNRLTGFGGKTISYDAKGNITDFTTVGKFSYTNSSKPYAVTEISPYGTEIPLRNQTITYNGMMRPNSITEDAYVANLTYDTDGDRVKMQIKKNNADELIRYYLGGQYEFETGVAGTKEKLYLGGDAYSAAAVYVKEGSGAWTIYYLGRDYLGSLTHIIDAAGSLKQELSYDPWGRLRNPGNQQLYAVGSEPALFLGRGYTGHEHLLMFGLINMNARLYDPVLGRFLSPDPYVEAPGLSQNFNRFSYALNNPLRFSDETGKFLGIDDLIAGIIGGAINLTANLISGNVHSFAQGASLFGVGFVGGVISLYATPTAGAAFMAGGNSIVNQGFDNGFNNISWGDVGINTVVGGITGAATMGLSAAVSPLTTSLTSNISSPILQNVATNSVTGVVSGFGVSTGFALANGSSWNDALNDGLQGAAFGLATGVVSGTVAGIKQAHEQGKNPITGAKKALTNDELVKKAGQKAEDAIGRKGATAGTAKHEYASDLIDRYQSMYGDKGLKVKYNFNNGVGNRGTLDVYSPKTNTIYDWKFGYPNKTIPQFMKTPQMIKYYNNFNSPRIVIFKF